MFHTDSRYSDRSNNVMYLIIDYQLPMHFPREHVSFKEHFSLSPHWHFPTLHVSPFLWQSSLVEHSGVIRICY